MGVNHKFNKDIKKKSVEFRLYEFRGRGYADELKLAAKKHDLAAIRGYDDREAEMPDIGLVRFTDSETGKVSVLDTSNINARRDYNLWWKQNDRQITELLNRSGVDFTTLRTDQNYVQSLLNLFKKRERRF